MNHKKILSFCFATTLIANTAFASTDHSNDDDFNWTEKEMKKKIGLQVEKPLTLSGWLTRYYENIRKKRDGKKIISHVIKKIKRNKKLWKYVKRCNKKLAQQVADKERINGLKILIHERIRKNYPRFAHIKCDITKRIMRKIPDKNNLHGYLGKDLDVKIAREITIYQQEQQALSQQHQPQPSAPPMPSCCGCGKNVTRTGTSCLLKCGHEYCSACCGHLTYPWICPSCRTQKNGSICGICGTQCYQGCPRCGKPAKPESHVTHYSN